MVRLLLPAEELKRLQAQRLTHTLYEWSGILDSSQQGLKLCLISCIDIDKSSIGQLEVDLELG